MADECNYPCIKFQINFHLIFAPNSFPQTNKHAAREIRREDRRLGLAEALKFMD